MKTKILITFLLLSLFTVPLFACKDSQPCSKPHTVLLRNNTDKEVYYIIEGERSATLGNIKPKGTVSLKLKFGTYRVTISFDGSFNDAKVYTKTLSKKDYWDGKNCKYIPYWEVTE